MKFRARSTVILSLLDSYINIHVIRYSITARLSYLCWRLRDDIIAKGRHRIYKWMKIDVKRNARKNETQQQPQPQPYESISFMLHTLPHTHTVVQCVWNSFTLCARVCKKTECKVQAHRLNRSLTISHVVCFVRISTHPHGYGWGQRANKWIRICTSEIRTYYTCTTSYIHGFVVISGESNDFSVDRKCYY